VDDHPIALEVVKHHVHHWHTVVDCAGSAKEALAVLQRETAAGRPYSVVLIDMKMPEMDGLALVRAIKADPALADMRLAVLTPFSLRNDAELSNEGVTVFLPKPLKQSRLLGALALGHATPSRRRSRILSKDQMDQQESSSNVRILLADDNSDNQKLSLRQLKKLGYTAEAVGNGLEVLEMLSRIPYDIVLMDCQMPELDGYAACAEIRRREGTFRHTTVIAMTANAMGGDREKCLAAGMDDYISKPVHVDELKAVLERWSPPASPVE
jgi:CheY-like chemotaxis protein